jgi:UDP-glucose 4-epimerase
MEKILVTGGAGFIGSHTVVALQESRYEVVIVDNLSNSELAVIDRITQITGVRPSFEEVDLTDSNATFALFKKYGKFDAVIHFAALKAVGESVYKPLEYYRNNIVSLLNILDGMKKTGCEKIVYSSSCTVYGDPDELPVTEKSPRKRAISPYGNTKKIAEEILTDTVYAAHLGVTPLKVVSLPQSQEHAEEAPPAPPLKVVSLRYFNPIGAHPSAIIGELPLGVPNNLVPYITQTAAGIRPVLNVFGDDYNTPDGTPIRDYIHVCDLAEAHVAALEYEPTLAELGVPDSVGSATSFIDTFNIGTGQGYSVLEVIKSFEKVSGVALNYRISPRRAGDIEKIWGDPSKAERLLGWKATRSLDEMMLSAWQWQVALG